jgi:hypothetical protein
MMPFAKLGPDREHALSGSNLRLTLQAGWRAVHRIENGQCR